MSDINKAISFLKTRSIKVNKSNTKLIQNQIEVVPLSEVVSVFEMVKNNSLDTFLSCLENKSKTSKN